MGLTPGTRLGPYEIITPIGAGGMGEVYKARDTRLDRPVAVKVLPKHIAADPDLRQRFEREARTLASLSHPHICPIHDVGSQDGIEFLVMELLEGETLADRLERGPLPLDQAVQIAVQIADALDRAHRTGIVHRDLKPGNIMLTRTGAKLLDFGLAKLHPLGAPGNVGLTAAATVGAPLTSAGSILGTFQYMAPEQLEGREADARTDIFAFGAVVYEMVTGTKAFSGTSQAGLLSAIMTSDPPPVSTDGRSVPATLDRIVRACLAKDPDDRFQSAHDLRRALEWSGTTEAVGPRPQTSKASKGWVAVAAVLALALAGLWWWAQTRSVVAPEDLILTIAPPADATLIGPTAPQAVPYVSPDGTAVIYTDLSYSYRLRRLGSLSVEPLATPVPSTTALWTSDSRSVVFDGGGALWKKALPDGVPERVTATEGPVLGATMSGDGALLYSVVTTRARLLLLPAGETDPVPLVLPGLPEGSYLEPEFIPGTRDFLVAFEPTSGADDADIYLSTLDANQPTRPVLLMRNRTVPRYTPAGGGRLLFVRDDVLYAQRLDVGARHLVGEPSIVLRNVASGTGFRRGLFSVSRTGVLAWRPGGVGQVQIVTFDRNGRRLGTSGPPSVVFALKLSPDDRHLLVADQTEQYLVEPNTSGRLLVSRGRDPVTTLWSPDATHFLVPRPDRLLSRPVSGGSEEKIADVPGLNRLEDVSPDGKTVLFTGGALATKVFAAAVDGSSSPRVVLDTGERVWDTRFSPDGRWIVFEAHPDGTLGGSLYVQPFPGPGLRRQISPRGSYPLWRRDGREILFLDGAQVQSVRVDPSGGDLRFAEPTPLFAIRSPGGVRDVTPWAVSSDGSRIYLPQPVQDTQSDVIHIRTGWTPE